MMPLAFIRGRARIVRIAGGHGVAHKLYSLGIYPGETVNVINNMSGPVLLDVKGSRVALGRGMAMKIYVEEL